MAPELEGRILDQLDEGDEETPRVRPVHDQPLQQNPKQRGGNVNQVFVDDARRHRPDLGAASPGDLLLDGLGVGLGKQIEHRAAEVVSVTVGVTQLIGDRIQEQVTPWKKKIRSLMRAFVCLRSDAQHLTIQLRLHYQDPTDIRYLGEKSFKHSWLVVSKYL